MSDDPNIVPFRGRGTQDGGGDQPPPDLVYRVARVEDRLERIEAVLERLSEGQQRMAVDLAELKGRFTGLENRIAATPTTLQLLGLFLAVLVASGLLQWFGPRLTALVPQPTAGVARGAP